MKRWVGAAIVVAVGLLATARGQQPVRPAPETVPGEVLVQYRRIVQPVRRDAIVATRRGRLARRFDQLDIDHITLDAFDNVAAAVAAFRAMPEVAAASPNYVRHAVQAQSPPPNDPKWLDGSLWGLVKIQAQSAWNTLNARGDGSVVIMDIDTGLNYNHQDLAANVWTNPGENPNNGLDDDNDGYVNDIHGIDTVNHDSNPIDDNGHGTHTAGTIAAVGNNGLGVVGVNWNAKILPCKFLDAGGSGSDAGAAECLNYAVTLKTQHGVNIRVTNNSWGGYRNGGDFSVLQNAFDAAGNAGIISFVAAGNDNLNIDTPGNEFDPASLSTISPSIVAVASSDQNDNRSSFSNWGPTSVALAAPGSSILSTYNTSNSAYATASGTSMATPHVAGVAALLSSMDPALNVGQLKALITNNVDVLASFGGLTITGGRLNAFLAASAVGGPGASATFVTTDTATQGNWIGTYGGDGYSIVSDATSLPSYATLAAPGAAQYTWASSTGDQRAPLRAGGVSGRVAAAWYNNSFDLDVNLAGGQAHQVALYAVDWDSTTRSQRVDVLDAATSTQLDTRTTTGFNGGQYLVWNITGHVKFHVTRLAGANAVVNAVFFGAAGAVNHPPTAALTGPPDNSTYTAPASVQLTATASDPDPGDTIDHVTFYANSSPIGTATTPVSGVYSVNWNNVTAGNYALTAVATDNHSASGPASNVRNVTVNGGGGSNSAAFLTNDPSTQGNWIGAYGADGYSLVGDATSLPAYAQLTTSAPTWPWATSTSDPRALLRAGGATGRVAATWYGNTFDLNVNLTDGLAHQVALYAVDWDGTSRSERVDVVDFSTNAVLDSRTLSSFNGGQYEVWTVRGHVIFRLTRLAGANAVTSAVFFGSGAPGNHPPTATLTGPPDNSAYTAPVSVPLTATASDPDAGDTIDHVTFFANGSQIGTVSTPVAGVYSFNWNAPAGSYTLTAVATDNHGAPSAASNARHITVNPAAGGNAAVFLGSDASTQGNWIGMYGINGYSLVGDATSLPAYAQLTPGGAAQWTWAASTSDARALQRTTSGRVAATWYGDLFTLDVNLTDGQPHQVTLYSVDWDTSLRSERIDVLDGVTSAVLDTRTLSSFNGGVYLAWTVTGHVTLRFTKLTGANAVVSAIFIGPGSAPAPTPETASEDRLTQTEQPAGDLASEEPRREGTRSGRTERQRR